MFKPVNTTRIVLISVLLLSLHLCVPALLQAQMADTPNASPRLQAIRSALQGRVDGPSAPVLLRGTITHTGSTLIIQDQTGAIAVHPAHPTRLAVGDEAEVFGINTTTNGIHSIEQAQVASLWRSSPPAALALTPDSATEGQYNVYLVEVEGQLIKEQIAADGSVKLMFESDHQFFSATLEAGPESRSAARKRFEPGSMLRVTGVLSVRTMQDNLQSDSFVVQLRTFDDIRMVKAAPWPTPAHILELAFGVLILIGILHYLRLKNLQARFAAITAERSRIARDIHDTLAQSFAGIAFQLEGAVRELEKNGESARDYLNMALNMVRHSRAEAHRSISRLRAFSRDLPLGKMLEGMVQKTVGSACVNVHHTTTGSSEGIDPGLAEQLFRIAQEGFSNALHHSRAANIWISLDCKRSEVALSIADDGVGFDTEHVDGPHTGHFGLAGIKERVERIRGVLDLKSSSAGTQIHVRIPVKRTRATPLRALWSNVYDAMQRGTNKTYEG
jgi:signal transduction histidine kinase